MSKVLARCVALPKLSRFSWLMGLYAENHARLQRLFAPADLACGAYVSSIGDGLDQLGGVDCKDQWVYGGIKDTSRKPAFRIARVRIAPQGGVEELPDVTGIQWVPNPRYPVLHTRHDHLDEPFGANRWWWDLDGSHRRIGQWGLETCHAAWQGNGEHLLLGDGLARGRRWNEPAPGTWPVRLSMFDHFESFSRGVVETRDVAYFACLVLFAAVSRLCHDQIRRWR